MSDSNVLLYREMSIFSKANMSRQWESTVGLLGRTELDLLSCAISRLHILSLISTYAHADLENMT